MTSAERELFRHKIVAYLAAAGAAGVKLPRLQVGLQVDGYSASNQELADELDYLAGKGLAVQMDKLLSPENPRWKITAAGRDYAATEGLA